MTGKKVKHSSVNEKGYRKRLSDSFMVKEEIYDLKEEDYKSGPSVDRDDPSSDHFWVFKKKVDGNSIYIKFKVLYQKDGGVRVVSFHIDEY